MKTLKRVSRKNWSERAIFTNICSKRLLFLRFYSIFQKVLEVSRCNLHYKFAFVGEYGADECGVSPEFHSSNVDDSCQPITEAFPGAKFEIY